MYATLNPKNGDTGYLFLNIWLCAVKKLKILQEYADLEDIFNKEAV